MASGVRAGRAYIELGTDHTALMRGLSRAQSTLSRWGSRIAGIGAKITGAVSLGAMPAMLSTKIFADFDDAMRTVKAVTGATQEQFKSLTGTAERLGRETSFSAKQVAEGMAALGRMGFKPDQIEAAIPAVMNLSRATGTELATAAEIAANNMNVFGLSADQMASVADILTATANGSAQTLEDLGEGLKMAAPQGAAAGENIRAVAASLGILANMGLKGSMAGNALKKAYSQFAKTKIQDKLAQVGIRTTTDTGDLRSMPDIMADIGAAMASMPTARRLAFAEEIFDMRGALAGLNLGAKAEDLRKFLEMLNNSSGMAENQALEQDSGIGGTLRKMASAAEGLAITFGRIVSEAVQPYIESLAKVMVSLAEWLGRHKTAIQTAVRLALTIGSVGVAMVAFGKALTVASMAVGVVHGVMSGIAFVFGFFRAVVVGTTAAIHVMQGVCITLSGVMSAVSAGLITMAGVAQAAFAAILAASPFTLLAAGLAALGAYALWVGGLFEGMGAGLAAAFGGVGDALKETFATMKATLQAGDMGASMQAMFAGVRLAFAEFMQGVSPWWDKFCFTINETWETMGDNILKAWYTTRDIVMTVFYSLLSGVDAVLTKMRQAWNWIKAYTPGSGYSVANAERDNAVLQAAHERNAAEYERRGWGRAGEDQRAIDEMAAQRTMESSAGEWAKMAEEARASLQAIRDAASAKNGEEDNGDKEKKPLPVPTALRQMPQMPGMPDVLKNQASGSFNARAFTGGGGADWSLVRGIRDIARQIEKNTENETEEEVFA